MMLPENMNHLWAKSPGYRQRRGESLAAHTWQVLQRLADLAQLYPNLAAELREPRLWHRLFWAGMLHDLGKAAAGFQAQLRGEECWGQRHEVLSLAFVDWLFPDSTNEDRLWVVAGVVSHHRDAAEIFEWYPPDLPPEYDDLPAMVAEIAVDAVQDIWDWLHEYSQSWATELALTACGVEFPPLMPREPAIATFHAQGAARIRRALHKYQRWVRVLSRGRNAERVHPAIVLLRGLLIRSDHAGSAHMPALPHVTYNVQTILQQRHIAETDLRHHQRAVRTTNESILITAPTGSGKTEAALLWACKLAEETGGVPRLFYTLPYQASMNAMYDRLVAHFGGSNVGLQHGRSLLALYRKLQDRDYTPEDAARQARAARDLSKLLYYPIRVLSPYQMLKALYRLKGYEMMLADFYGAVFIFDEIHAYEVGRLAMILQMVEYLRRHYRARFMVMSATFPTIIKKQLHRALGITAEDEICAAPQVFAEFRRHRLKLLDGEIGDAANLEVIAQRARRGQMVLVCCNIVARAQMVFEQLRARLPEHEVLLLHSRYTIRDRLVCEKRVMDATSDRRPPSNSPPLGGTEGGITGKENLVLVSTQVVEVSLDIDFDTIFTEPAPLEALIQRFGRVNRRNERALADVHVFRAPDDGQVIYDEALVRASLRILERENGKPIDEAAVGDWLDEIYAGEIAAKWQLEFDTAAREFARACVDTLRPFEASDELRVDFYKAFDGIEVLPIDLEDEYYEKRDAEDLGAYELTVPLSYRRYAILHSYGKAMQGEQGEPPRVLVPYDGLGLRLDLAEHET